MLAVAGWLAWREGRSRWGTLVYLLQLTLNAAWPWIFFDERRLGWALVCAVALWLAILATFGGFWRVSRTAAILLLPYLAWWASPQRSPPRSGGWTGARGVLLPPWPLRSRE